MDILHIEARKKFDELDFSCLDKLPGKTISLAATVQYLDLVPKIKEYLELKGKEIIIKKGAFHNAHVLGCFQNAFDKNTDSLLLIADGKFHALNNAIALDKEIFVFNTHSLEKITNQDIDKVKTRIKAKIKRFFASDNIGILVSTKKGQYQNPEQLKKSLEKKGKKVYIFESDNLDLNELENFDLPVWINTACPGLGLENPKVLNLRDILDFI